MSIATIGSALRERRQELGLEKGQAADKIGMSRTTYSSYEQDAQRPSVDVFPALAGFLEISIEELLVLYGATCVAAVRPSLDRLLSSHLAEDPSGAVAERVPVETEPNVLSPSELSDVHVTRAEEWLEENQSVESRTWSEASEVFDLEGSPVSSLEWMDVLKDPERKSLPEVAATSAPESLVEFENSELADPIRETEIGQESVASSEPPESQIGLVDSNTLLGDSQTAEAGSTGHEPSPFVITIPKFDSRRKDSTHKKKKKKKKKK
ncbi:MAG: Helix-turn-helix domain [Acidimicrobiaceae bacterium]|nr:Helix-turn-helix domain [Acidimicrobiaceae bacterium]